MPDDMLIVDDLLLLMLDDDSGIPAAAGTLYYTLGGAVLVELALAGRIEPEPGRGELNGPDVHATGDGPLPEPLLQDAYDTVANRPTRVQPLILKIGATLWDPVTDRLVQRGLVHRELKRRLGLFRTARFPSARTDYERDLRARVAAVLQNGDEPEPHLAAVIGLLSAGNALPRLHPHPAWSGPTATRAKEIERGNWGAGAVNTAVTRTAAAIAASTAPVTVTVVSTTTS